MLAGTSAPQVRVSFLVNDGFETRRVPLLGTRFLIGRDTACHLRPPNRLVSRRHAEITLEGDTLFVRDLASSNGTFVNEDPINAPTRLRTATCFRSVPSS